MELNKNKIRVSNPRAYFICHGVLLQTVRNFPSVNCYISYPTLQVFHCSNGANNDIFNLLDGFEQVPQ